MKITRWSFNNLHVAMVQNDEGVLYCTTKQLADALCVSEDVIRMAAMNHKDEFGPLSITNFYAKEFFQRHKVELGIKRVRKDIKMWSEDEMILLAMLCKSNVSKEFRKDMIKFVKENARRGYVTQEEHNKTLEILGQYIVRTENLEKILTPGKQVQLRVVQ